jgi:cell wall-associated NlpC family hydrolase
VEADRIVARARVLVGTKFRAQGRSTAGLDCIGLASLTFGVDRRTVRDDYRLRGSDNGPRLRAALQSDFRRISRRQLRPGDLILLQPGRDQWHLAVMTDAGMVHADARIGAVVETPGDPAWPIVGVYRLRVRARRN